MSVVHENEHYVVEAAPSADSKDEYRVRNKATGNVEFEDRQIANAITYSEHGAAFLKLKLWRLVKIQGEQSAAFLDNHGAGVALDETLNEQGEE